MNEKLRQRLYRHGKHLVPSESPQFRWFLLRCSKQVGSTEALGGWPGRVLPWACRSAPPPSSVHTRLSLPCQSVPVSSFLH